MHEVHRCVLLIAAEVLRTETVAWSVCIGHTMSRRDNTELIVKVLSHWMRRTASHVDAVQCNAMHMETDPA